MQCNFIKQVEYITVVMDNFASHPYSDKDTFADLAKG